jgi:hypothetical protein
MLAGARPIFYGSLRRTAIGRDWRFEEIMRQAAQVARRAVAMTALAFRASLEVTDHPRSTELSGGILGWLESAGAASELEPIERDLLGTPYRQLDKQQIGDAHWSGEGAWILAWAIGHAELPSLCEPVDCRPLFERLRIMRPEVHDLLTGARLRSDDELTTYSVSAWAFRSELHLRRVGTARTLLAKIERGRLEELGLAPSEEIIAETAKLVAGLSDEECQTAAGPAFVREYAIFWLFSDHPGYFED